MLQLLILSSQSFLFEHNTCGFILRFSSACLSNEIKYFPHFKLLMTSGDKKIIIWWQEIIFDVIQIKDVNSSVVMMKIILKKFIRESSFNFSSILNYIGKKALYMFIWDLLRKICCLLNSMPVCLSLSPPVFLFSNFFPLKCQWLKRNARFL